MAEPARTEDDAMLEREWRTRLAVKKHAGERPRRWPDGRSPFDAAAAAF
jgi:hypothetical protein